MSFTGLLQHRADLERLIGETDPYGKPKQQYAALATAVPCRLSRDSGDDERTTLETRGYVDQGYRLFFDSNVDLAEADKVTEVRDAAGNVLIGDLVIESVRAFSGAGQAHHIEVWCQSRRGSQEWPRS